MSKSVARKRSVAIVGNSSETLQYAKHSQADEFWTMNHLGIKMLREKEIPRIDRLFELHEKDWFLRKELDKSAAIYWKWLQEEHPFPIYMHAVHPDIPASVRYPKDEIFSALLPHFHKFFTSSVCWMLALAVYEGFERIELYGIEMQYGTEYYYQQPGGTFWIGYALGRGIEVVLHEKSTLCKAKLYGYETAPYASREVLETYRAFYAERRDILEEIYQNEAEAWNIMAANGNTPDERMNQQARLLNAHADVAVVWGGMKMVENILEDTDLFASRQRLEGLYSTYRIAMEKWKGETNYRRAEFNGIFTLPDTTKQIAQEKFNAYTHAWEAMHRYSGGVQVLQKLMDECDMRHVDMELIQLVEEREAA